MKTLFTFLIQFLVVGGLAKLAVVLFVPKAIRFLTKDLFHKSIEALAKSIYTVIDDIKADVNSDDEDDVVEEAPQVNHEAEYAKVINFRQRK